MSGRQFRQRCALWALGQALPPATALNTHLRALLLAVAIAAAGGVLAVVSAGSLLAAAYFYFVQHAPQEAATLLMVAFIALAAMSLALHIIRGTVTRCTDISESLELFSGSNKNDVEKLCLSLAEEFIEGLFEDRE